MHCCLKLLYTGEHRVLHWKSDKALYHTILMHEELYLNLVQFVKLETRLSDTTPELSMIFIAK